MDIINSEIDIIQENVESWKGLAKTQVQFERLAGLSNLIWKVTALVDQVEPKAVIYRKFGEVTGVFDRARENHIFRELSKSNLGPVSYGFSSEFRIEEFCENESVGRNDVREVSLRRSLAKELSRFHSAKIAGINQDPFILKVLKDGLFDKDFEKKVLTTEFTDYEKIMLDEITTSIYSKEERDFLMNLLPTTSKSLVFAHNDLHAGNILRLKDNDRYLFIDCEYNDYNYRGFDIANLFNETMLDYSHPIEPFYAVNDEQYPPSAELEDFAKYYTFFSMFPDQSDNEDTESYLKDSSLIDDYVRAMGKTPEFMKEIDELLQEIEVCKLLSHYYWVIWSVIFSKKAEIKFDYISYGLDRLKLYKKAKAEFVEKQSATIRDSK